MAWPFGRFRFVVLIGVAVFVLWKVSLSLGYFWFFPNSETLLGDLRGRYREFHFFSQGLDPKLQDPLLGYPAWSYLMAGIWAWPERFDQAKLLFLAIQSVALAVVGYDLMGRLRLGLPAMILVAVASAPVYVLLDLLGLGNYGIIEAAFFYFFHGWPLACRAWLGPGGFDFEAANRICCLDCGHWAQGLAGCGCFWGPGFAVVGDRVEGAGAVLCWLIFYDDARGIWGTP